MIITILIIINHIIILPLSLLVLLLELLWSLLLLLSLLFLAFTNWANQLTVMHNTVHDLRDTIWANRYIYHTALNIRNWDGLCVNVKVYACVGKQTYLMPKRCFYQQNVRNRPSKMPIYFVQNVCLVNTYLLWSYLWNMYTFTVYLPCHFDLSRPHGVLVLQKVTRQTNDQVCRLLLWNKKSNFFRDVHTFESLFIFELRFVNYLEMLHPMSK